MPRNGDHLASGTATGIMQWTTSCDRVVQLKRQESSMLRGKPGGEMADGTSASNRIGVSPFVTGEVRGSTALQHGFDTAGTNVTRGTAVINILTKRLRRFRGARVSSQIGDAAARS
jgi:hypothetical protein